MKQITPLAIGSCYPSLPQSYSDSLSFYEELARIAYKLNELINALNEDYTVLIREFLDKYFNQIMIESVYRESAETIVLSIR